MRYFDNLVPTMENLETFKQVFFQESFEPSVAIEAIYYFAHPFFAHNCLNEKTLDALDEETHQGLFNWHRQLLEAVKGIHASEEDAYHQSLSRQYLSVRDVFMRARDGARGDRIYYLETKLGKTDFIGDIHSDPEAILSILEGTGFLESVKDKSPHRLVFMGDYVDRGRAHLSTTALLLTLKYVFPDRIVLLRGNHDGGEILEDGQLKLPYKKYEEEPAEDFFPTYLEALERLKGPWRGILAAYLTFWKSLGQIAFIRSGDTIDMAVHGGVPRPVKSEQKSEFAYLSALSELTDETSVDAFGRQMIQNIMWSDPYRGTGDLREGMGRFYFTEAQATDFLTTLQVNRLFRGHEAVEEGFREHFDGKVFTVFSTGGQGRYTAYDFVEPKWARVDALGRLSSHALKKFEMGTKIFEKHIDNHYHFDL